MGLSGACRLSSRMVLEAWRMCVVRRNEDTKVNGRHPREWVRDVKWQLEEYLREIDGVSERIKGVQEEEDVG